MKKCRLCGEIKDLDLFAKHKGRKDGRDSRCKQCKSKYDRETRRERAANDPDYLEAKREYDRDWKRNRYANDPEWAKSQRERNRNRRANDPELAERHRESGREWKRNRRANDPDYVKKEREYMREYLPKYIRRRREEDPDYGTRRRRNKSGIPWHKTPQGKIANRLYVQRYEDRIRETDNGSVTTESMLALRDQQNNRCFYCRKVMNDIYRHPDQATMEHRQALSKGGSHTIDNMAWSCWKCNTSKQAEDEAEWMARMGYVLDEE